MSVREHMHHNPGIAVCTAVVLFLTALTYGLWLLHSRNSPNEESLAFFTVDDGRTWFPDNISKVPPFERDGKLAYRCYVYTRDGGRTLFVSHLERYSDDAKRLMQQLKSKKDLDPASIRMLREGIEVKRPGAPDATWIRKSDPRAASIIVPHTPPGLGGEVVLVHP